MAVVDDCLERILAWYPSKPIKPLFVGINGPQGAGKTVLCSKLVDLLAKKGIRALAISCDDFYYSCDEQCKLAAANAGNPLLEYRGLPGTHSIQLGADTLQSLADGIETRIPRYDKSLNMGQGDRLGYVTHLSVDIVLFEGWFLGFQQLPEDEIAAAMVDGKSRYLSQFKLDHLLQVNRFLSDYQKWTQLMDCFIQISAQDLSFIAKWRLEQENTAKVLGRDGLSNDQVLQFVARFMPMYELYLPLMPLFLSKFPNSLLVTLDSLRRNIPVRPC